MRNVAKNFFKLCANLWAACKSFLPGSRKITARFCIKNLKCSHDFLSICGDLIIPSGVDALFIVALWNVFIFNGNIRVGIVYMVILTSIL